MYQKLAINILPIYAKHCRCWFTAFENSIPLHTPTRSRLLSHDHRVVPAKTGALGKVRFLNSVRRRQFGRDTRPLLRKPEVARDVTGITLADWLILGYLRRRNA